MIKDNYMLYQGPFAEDGCLYTMELCKPYSESNTKDSAKEALTALVPENIALGSIGKFISEDENGSRYEWKYEWEQNEDEEKLFMLIAETYIDRVPNGEVVPEGTKNITENGTGIDVYDYAKVDVAVPLPSGKIEITENATDLDIAQYAYADVNVSGGGGGIAEVTLVNTTTSTYAIDYPVACVLGDDWVSVEVLSVPDGDSITIGVPLYGEGYVFPLETSSYGSFVLTVTGDAELLDDKVYMIKGDCTITVSNGGGGDDTPT